MDDTSLRSWWARSGVDAGSGVGVLDVSVAGRDPVLAVRHRIGEGAAAALALVGAHAAAVHHGRGGPPQSVVVDASAAATTLLGFVFQQVDGVELHRHRNALIDQYPTGDGRWIHLHGGFPHLATGLTDLLGLPAGSEEDRTAIAAAVASHDAGDLEEAIAEAGLCGAVVRSVDEWAAHPQGALLATVPAVTVERIGDGPARPLDPSTSDRPRPLDPSTSDRPRPLDDVRVLDQTRVLAGAACGRTLASLGASVLRIGAARLPSIEPFVIDTGHGKRNAFVDLADEADRAVYEELVADADVIAQGYRPGALDRYGASAQQLAETRPGAVVVQVSCYGSTGPWGNRPGWEQLAQSVTGMSWTEGEARGDGAPTLIPAAATDYTTGYLAAAGTLAALRRRATEGGSWLVRVSLCQTARWFQDAGLVDDPSAAPGLGDVSSRQVTTASAWGPLTHLAPVLGLSATPCRWDRPPEPLGASPAEWW